MMFFRNKRASGEKLKQTPLWSNACLKQIPHLFPVSSAHIFAQGHTHTQAHRLQYVGISFMEEQFVDSHTKWPKKNCEKNPFNLPPLCKEFKRKYAKTKTKIDGYELCARLVASMLMIKLSYLIHFMTNRPFVGRVVYWGNFQIFCIENSYPFSVCKKTEIKKTLENKNK